MYSSGSAHAREAVPACMESVEAHIEASLQISSPTPTDSPLFGKPALQQEHTKQGSKTIKPVLDRS